MKKLFQTILLILAAIIFNALLSNPVTQVYMVALMVFVLIAFLIWFMCELTRKNDYYGI